MRAQAAGAGMRATLLLGLAILLGGCMEAEAPSQPGAPAVWAEDVPVLAAWFSAPHNDEGALGLVVREDGSALRLRFTHSASASVETPPDAREAALLPEVYFQGVSQRNVSAGIRAERVEVGWLPLEARDALERDLREHWDDPCAGCEGNVSTFVWRREESYQVATARLDQAPALHEAFAKPLALFAPARTYELPPLPQSACVRVSVDAPVLVEAPPVRIAARAANCGETTLVATGNGCDPSGGFVISIAHGEGPMRYGTVAPAAGPQPAWNRRAECVEAEPVSLAPGESVERVAEWDGTFAGQCDLPMQGCDLAYDAAPGIYRVGAAFQLPRPVDGASADAELVIAGDDAPRLPLLRASVTYTKTRVGAEVPAQGEGCDAFDAARSGAAVTPRTPEGESAAAVLLREYPQGGYGTFGPRALAVPREGALALHSAFDPARVLANVTMGPDGPRVDGEPIPEAGVTTRAAFHVTWQGETYAITEDVELRRAGEVVVLPGQARPCG